MNLAHYTLQRQRNGSLAVRNEAYAETMHPGAGPWAEANGLYVQGGGLPEALAAPGTEPVVVFDVGLGAAANALAALTCHEDLRRRGRPARPLHIVSFESDAAAPAYAIEQADALQYPRGHEETLAALLRDGHVPLPGGGAWELRLGDFPALVQDEPRRADVIFFDPFSPRANPEMWRLATLEALYRCRRRAGTRLVTYSTAYGTRAGLLLAGWYVGEGPTRERAHGSGPGRSTIAATWPGDLAQPLNEAWLARWRHDREAWPPLTEPGEHRALRTRLLEHPQWAGRASQPEPDGTAAEPRAAERQGGRPGRPGRRGRSRQPRQPSRQRR